MVETSRVCGDCGWSTNSGDHEEDAHSQAYLHAETTGHTFYGIVAGSVGTVSPAYLPTVNCRLNSARSAADASA